MAEPKTTVKEPKIGKNVPSIDTALKAQASPIVSDLPQSYTVSPVPTAPLPPPIAITSKNNGNI